MIEEGPSEDGILAFITWLDISGLASQTPQIVQVVVNNLQFEGKEDYRKSLAITQVLRAIKKEATKDKTPDWPRDPLPGRTLWHYINAPLTWVDSTMHSQDMALVALGLRTMRRPGELGNFDYERYKMGQ